MISEDHVTLKTGVNDAEHSALITAITARWNYNYITSFIFNQINAVLVSKRDLFQSYYFNLLTRSVLEILTSKPRTISEGQLLQIEIIFNNITVYTVFFN